jgi:hypothetical protein
MAAWPQKGPPVAAWPSSSYLSLLYGRQVLEWMEKESATTFLSITDLQYYRSMFDFKS